jgi:hypothetical protein
MDFPDLGVTVNLPKITGIASQGIFATIGYFLEMVFGLLLIIWIGYSIFAAYKIITSNMAKGLEEGVTIIKNVWVGISIGLGFFIVLSLVGTIIGVGDVTSWHTNLSQCHDASGGFYFKDVEEQRVGGIPEKDTKVYCCKILTDISKVKGVSVVDKYYKHSTFKEGTWHYVLEQGIAFNDTLVSDCEKF